MSRVYEHVGDDPSHWHSSLGVPVHAGDDRAAVQLPATTRQESLDRVAVDQHRLAELMGECGAG